MPRSHLVGVAATVQNEMQKHASLLTGVLTHKERKTVSSFVQAPEDYFDAEPTFKQSYAPQSGEIFGILKPYRSDGGREFEFQFELQAIRRISFFYWRELYFLPRTVN